jgi:hypothetical protein
MNNKVASGASLAIAAVALAMNGVTLTPASAKSAVVHCAGINSCKGTSACQSANNSCKGENSCKGHGWLPAKSAKACEAKGGKVV